MADNLVFEESLNTEIDSSEFISKKWVYVNDNNAQNYTSQVVIDSTPLSNAGQWINWSESFIIMPLVVQLTSLNPASLPTGVDYADWSWAFKNGYWNLLNSMTVEFNNQNVVQQTPFLNVFRSFKAMTSFSLDDIVNVGSDIGFYPDSSTSWSYNLNSNTTNNDANLNGRGVNAGIQNNANNPFFQTNTSTFDFTSTTYVSKPSFPTTGVAGDPQFNPDDLTGTNMPFYYQGTASTNTDITQDSSYNVGLLKRQQYLNFNSYYSPLNQDLIYPTSTCNSIYKNFATQTVSGSIVWNIFAKLRLKDLADFFDKMPLLKGATIRFYINTNQTSINFNTTCGAISTVTSQQSAFAALQVANVNTIGGLTNPLILTSVGAGQGGSSLPSDFYNLSVSIYKNQFPTINGIAGGQSPLQSCRLYAPLYTMNPLAESKYLSLTPTKKIMYEDVFQYQFSNITGPFNILVTNGISNIKSVLVVPFLSKSQIISSVSSIGTVVNTGFQADYIITNLTSSGNQPLQFSAPQNPFSSAPATPDPIAITNFNILVSGVNLFLNNQLYDFQAFSEQLSQSNQLNGGLTTGLASGLIGPQDFSSLYRYYYGDASRILPSEEGVSRSVQVVGQIANGALAVDLMIFVSFMKEITIDISTGARIE